jgi:mono/diheme cytochrome c family protein
MIAALLALAASVLPEPAQERGREIFARGGNVTAIVANGGAGVPVTGLACAGCHADDARGRREAGVAAPDITWATLAKPYEVTLPDGRARRPYSPRLLIRAITLGVDSSGNALAPSMPRYQLTSADASALVAFLQRFDAPRDPGVRDDAIEIAVAGDPVTPGETELFQRRIAWQRGGDREPLAIVARTGAAGLPALAASGTPALIELEGPPPARFPEEGDAYVLDADGVTRARALLELAGSAAVAVDAPEEIAAAVRPRIGDAPASAARAVLYAGPLARAPKAATLYLVDADPAEVLANAGRFDGAVYLALPARRSAAAPLLLEALRAAGRDVTRARLTTEIRRLLGYGEHQRSERAVQILRLDTQQRRFELVTPWIVGAAD